MIQSANCERDLAMDASYNTQSFRDELKGNEKRERLITRREKGEKVNESLGGKKNTRERDKREHFDKRMCMSRRLNIELFVNVRRE